ncbi:hypothetical protein GUITHDRAFT_138048 [Guillardia theta CCMP2712]|uniref:DUF4281 domain-containing protein n=2 Tax=Guillardia theta TaxID=55529 RepID=L1JEC5_GUITC|nr:hypothetical protein GUITHDRAFT_138048 [Guillardia theta CCMP2712]EKX46667.1 hypothetical protein GUITHDRAFT_138048 [Guillardia theta CCMP2712]|mmetsp:Transcript_35494/g.111029  ORF Transcript_35494/g.111029 Transcript_35494/m.111029 type:complete len:152 (+) Transcript_35494:33-488(+)|eukprot:XP_005833647.1 hypothetical protein GUITHDRAFT_138048 [Guillardia theta CCMP2712]
MTLPFLNVVEEDVFQLVNGCLIGWLLLIAFPRWKHTPSVVLLVSAFYALLYTLLLPSSIFGTLPPGSSFTSLQGIVNLFSSKRAVLAGWVHYVSFDLLAARFILLDSQSAGIPHLFIVWIFPLTLLLGPAGLTSYLLLKPLVSGSKSKKAQ